MKLVLLFEQKQLNYCKQYSIDLDEWEWANIKTQYILTSLTTRNFMLHSLRTCISILILWFKILVTPELILEPICCFKVILLKWYGKEVKKLEWERPKPLAVRWLWWRVTDPQGTSWDPTRKMSTPQSSFHVYTMSYILLSLYIIH